MNKHTDAPWIAEGPGIFSTSSWVQVAEVNDALILADNNARLIAAAPELLSALRRIARISNRLNGGDWDEIEDARLIARDAIFAATGEETPIPEEAP